MPLQAADNVVLTRMVSEQRVFSQIFVRAIGEAKVTMVPRLALICRGHYRVLKAVQRRDPQQAQQAMMCHVREVGQYVLQNYDLRAQSKSKLGQMPITAQDLIAQMEDGSFHVDEVAMDKSLETLGNQTNRRCRRTRHQRREDRQ